MRDEIVIANACGGTVRIHGARTTTMVEEVRKVHHMQPTSCAALGRTMTATALIASDLKNAEEHVTARIDGKGPAGIISVQADGAGNVRGYIGNPEVYISRADGHLDVGAAVGTNGTLTISRDMGLKEPFTGVVNLRSGEIGEDFAYYFAISEQVPSVVSVGVLVDTDLSIKAAGGMIIQLLPGCPEEVITQVEKVAASMRPMTEYMSEDIEVEDLILQLFPDANILGHKPVQWHCDCSRESFMDSLAVLSEKDLLQLIEEDHGAEVVCQYCESKYQFSADDLKQVLESKKSV